MLSNLKKFFMNKTTVTILGIIVCILILFVGYNYRVNQKAHFEAVLYAKTEIPSNTQIEAKMLGVKRVNSDLIKNSPTLIKNMNQITDKSDNLYYVNFNYSIPKGGFLYADALISASDKADARIKAMPDGYRYVYLNVDLETTLGNSIRTGDSVDIYAFVNTNPKIYGKLVSNVNVVDVVTGKWNTTEKDEKNPNLLIALVEEEHYRFIEKAKRIGEIELIPAQNEEPFVHTPGVTEISSKEIEDYINNQYSAGDY